MYVSYIQHHIKITQNKFCVSADKMAMVLLNSEKAEWVYVKRALRILCFIASVTQESSVTLDHHRSLCLCGGGTTGGIRKIFFFLEWDSEFQTRTSGIYLRAHLF